LAYSTPAHGSLRRRISQAEREVHKDDAQRIDIKWRAWPRPGWQWLWTRLALAEYTVAQS